MDFGNIGLADLMVMAAEGDPDAQVAMSGRVLNCDVLATDVAVLSAEWWARIAATHDRPVDRHRLATVLMLTAGMQMHGGTCEAAIQNAGEAIAILDRLGDCGDVDADTSIGLCSEALRTEGIWDEVRAVANDLRR